MKIRKLKWSLFKIFYKIYSFKRLYNTNSSQFNFSNNYKKEYDLNEEQKEAIIGIILGDGSLEKGKSTFNTNRAQKNHSNFFF